MASACRFQAWCKLYDHGRGRQSFQEALAAQTCVRSHFGSAVGASAPARRVVAQRSQGALVASTRALVTLGERQRARTQPATSRTSATASAVRPAFRETQPADATAAALATTCCRRRESGCLSRARAATTCSLAGAAHVCSSGSAVGS